MKAVKNCKTQNCNINFPIYFKVLDVGIILFYNFYIIFYDLIIFKNRLYFK